VTGALQSGERAAREVAEHLQAKSMKGARG